MISNLKGAGRYEKQEKKYKSYSQNREIIKSTLLNTNNNDQTIFLENNFSIREKPDNTITFEIENYDGLGLHYMVIELTKKGIRELKKMIQ